MREEVNDQRGQESSELREQRPPAVARSSNRGRNRPVLAAGTTPTGHGNPWGLSLVCHLADPVRQRSPDATRCHQCAEEIVRNPHCYN